jgi:hypothetical protein
MLWDAFAWIGQVLASSAVSILAFIAIRSTAVGEKFLTHRLERKITDLKHLHDEKIETLRSQFAHLEDRGKRANELEFEAVAKIWHSFVDALQKTQQAILDYMSFPNLNQLPAEDLEAFLETSELSEQQRKQVRDADDKVRMFSNIMRLRRINTAGAAIYEGRLLLRTHGIFLPTPLAEAFKISFDQVSRAQTQQYIEFQHRRASDLKDSMAIIGDGSVALFTSLETAVRKTIRRQ